MYETLKDLHRKFYTRAVMPELKCDYDDAFQQLMSRLAKPERKLVLKAVDTKGLMMERAELDNFACGFQLALGLTTELQHYEEERSEEALAVLCTAGMGKSMEKSCRSACRYGERFCISVVVKLPKMV